MMSGIRGKDTKPELLVRHALRNAGYTYRLHVSKLPGKPDIVLSKCRVVILVHGCFWHGHDCHLFRWPRTRPEFWKSKITKNRQNDETALAQLRGANWRVFTVWECALRGKSRSCPAKLSHKIVKWIRGNKLVGELRG